MGMCLRVVGVRGSDGTQNIGNWDIGKHISHGNEVSKIQEDKELAHS